MTARCSGAKDGADPAAGLGHGRVAGRGGLGRGERPVRGTEPERVGQRLAVLADLSAGVDVEQAHASSSSLGAPATSAASTSAAGTAASTIRATSWVASG